MRITQSMLSSNMLRNLNTSYNKMGKLQEQVLSGKKVNRPSDDPVTVMKGMGFRIQVDKVAQYQRNMGEVHSRLDSADDSFDTVGKALQRASELAKQGANDVLTEEDRKNIMSELSQIQQQIQDMANTKVGDKYIFSGTKTSTKLYDGAGYPPAGTAGFDESVEIEVFDGISLEVNTNALELFREIDDVFKNILNNPNPDHVAFSTAMAAIDERHGDVLTERADIGARQNRAEMMENRLDAQEGIAKKQMSDNEDVNQAEAITEMITQESIHRAALSVGARIIQPSLVDFLR